MTRLEDILDIPNAHGRRGLEKAKKIVEAFIGEVPSETPVVKTKPGKVKEVTKVVT